MFEPAATPHPVDPRHQRGLAGEELAMAYLRREGWTIEAHRYRFGRHDIDLIARRGNLVAFVEVKTRSASRFGGPIQAVGWRKRRILDLGAAWWRERHGRPGDRFRFDVVGVHLEASVGPRVEHIEDAWRLGT